MKVLPSWNIRRIIRFSFPYAVLSNAPGMRFERMLLFPVYMPSQEAKTNTLFVFAWLRYDKPH